MCLVHTLAGCDCRVSCTSSDGADTDWRRIATLYGMLGRVLPSPVVELNRAVAVGMAFGPAAGLELVDALVSEPSLSGYHLLPSVRGDFVLSLAGLTKRVWSLSAGQRLRATPGSASFF